MDAATHFRTEDIGLGLIRLSSTNPRSRTDAKDLTELVESIRTHGVIQPITVRPVAEVSRGADAEFEVVAGHRRFTAAGLAGLKTIPAIVRELSDVQALELQLTENLQRRDLHPLDEAEGYRELTTRHGYTVEDLARKVAKSRAYVYQRLALANLTPAAKKLIAVDSMNVSVALAVARIPDAALQEQAAELISKGRLAGYTDSGKEEVEPYTAAQAREIISERFMLSMDSAPFDILDASLHPSAGPCSTCPKRTGNQPDLFGDLGKGHDLCTDPPCFTLKKTTAWQAATADIARNTNAVVLSLEASEKALPPHLGGITQAGGPYVRPTDHKYDTGSGGTWKQLAEKHGLKPRSYVALHPKTRKPVQLWRRADVLKAIRNASSPAAAKSGAGQADAPAAPKGDSPELAQEIRNSVMGAILRAYGDAAAKMSDQELLLAMSTASQEVNNYELSELAAVGLPAEKPLVSKNLRNTLKPAEVRRLALLVLGDSYYLRTDADWSRAFSVNVKALSAAAEKSARAEYAAKQKATAEAKPADKAAAKPSGKAAKKSAAKKGGKR